MTQTASRRRLHYGWIVVAVAGAAVLIGAGVRSAPGIFLLAMEEDIGISRSSVSLAVSLGLIFYGLAAPLSGRFVDRVGPRKVATLGLLTTATGSALAAVSNSGWQLDLFLGIVSGIGTGLIGSVLGAAIANRWFVTNRSMVVGLFGALMSAGQLLFIPLLSSISLSNGWRTATWGLAGISAAAILPVAWLVRDHPSSMGLAPYGATAPVPPPTPDDLVMRKALRSRDFWLLAGTFGICGLTTHGIVGTHFVAHAVEHGFTPQIAAGTLALMGAFNFIGTLASGWLTDRMDPRRLLMVYYAFRGLSLFFVPLVHDQLGLIAFAILFGLDYIATVPPTVALTVEVFGPQNVGTVYGWVFFAHQAGAALAAFGFGLLREGTGNYVLAFLLAGFMAVAAAVAALSIRRSPRPAVLAPV
jgi:predicted MFS family arabinose efflux permease